MMSSAEDTRAPWVEDVSVLASTHFPLMRQQQETPEESIGVNRASGGNRLIPPHTHQLNPPPSYDSLSLILAHTSSDT